MKIRRAIMGQKVNPHGLRVGVIKSWTLNGMQR